MPDAGWSEKGPREMMKSSVPPQVTGEGGEITRGFPKATTSV
jgi:hypothetical protein